MILTLIQLQVITYLHTITNFKYILNLLNIRGGMMFSKKAEGMSVNVIIVAILALLVLVVLSFVFAGKIGDFVKGTKQCQSIGGECLGACNIEQGYKEMFTAACLDKNTGKLTGEKCCIQIDKSAE